MTVQFDRAAPYYDEKDENAHGPRAAGPFAGLRVAITSSATRKRSARRLQVNSVPSVPHGTTGCRHAHWVVRWLRLVTTAFRLSACRCHTPGQRRIGRIFLQILDKAVTIPYARGSNLSSIGRKTLRAALHFQAPENSIHNYTSRLRATSD